MSLYGKNRCWYNIGSPPPATSKNDVLKFLSVNTIVIPPASTGNDNNNKTAVITTAHANKINLCNLIPGLLILNVVVMTLFCQHDNILTKKWTINSAHLYFRYGV